MIRKENIETEYKFIVKDKVVLIDVLNNLATIKKVHEFQVNKMFDNPDHLMKTSNGRIRVRNFGKGKKLFTYKKPLMSKSGAKREIEYQVDVIDKNDSLEKIFEQMEFFETTGYERYQTSWKLMNVSITLDEYPFVDFLEIEGSINEIQEVAKRLGFNISDGIVSPVDTLFQEWRKAHGLTFKPYINFDDYDK